MTKVMVIGARRRRQGVGEFLAHAFSVAGADVCAIVGTSPETAALAQAQLRERYGIRCTAYTSIVEGLEREVPDIVAICSPFDFHYEQLQAVLRAGAHCLCEKPLWWGETHDRIAATKSIVDGFIAQHRYLALVTQWPYTLPTFYRIYPELKNQPLVDFHMRLSPTRTGLNMVLDSVPHLLSMLQYLIGQGTVESPRAIFLDSDQSRLELDFGYRHGAGHTAVRFEASVCIEPPRPASYAINGCRIERRIMLPQYRTTFVGQKHQVEVEDPLRLLAVDYLNKVETRRETDRQNLIDGIAALDAIYASARKNSATEDDSRASSIRH